MLRWFQVSRFGQRKFNANLYWLRDGDGDWYCFRGGYGVVICWLRVLQEGACVLGGKVHGPPAAVAFV